MDTNAISFFFKTVFLIIYKYNSPGSFLTSVLFFSFSNLPNICETQRFETIVQYWLEMKLYYFSGQISVIFKLQ